MEDQEEVMRELAEQTVSLCLARLIHLGHVTADEVNGKWRVQYDETRLVDRGLGAAATIDRNGIPVVYLLSNLNVKGLGRAISHEAVHLMQICKGDLIPMVGYQIWRGLPYRTLPADSPEYFDAQPWEREAQDLQPLLLEYLQSKGFPV